MRPDRRILRRPRDAERGYVGGARAAATYRSPANASFARSATATRGAYVDDVGAAVAARIAMMQLAPQRWREARAVALSRRPTRATCAAARRRVSCAWTELRMDPRSRTSSQSSIGESVGRVLHTKQGCVERARNRALTPGVLPSTPAGWWWRRHATCKATAGVPRMVEKTHCACSPPSAGRSKTRKPPIAPPPAPPSNAPPSPPSLLRPPDPCNSQTGARARRGLRPRRCVVPSCARL